MKFLFFFSILCIFLSSSSIAAEKTDLSKFSCQPDKQKIDAFMLKEINPFSKSKKRFSWKKRNESNYIVSFYATWCAPCQDEVKLLINQSQELRKQNTEVIVISIDEKEKDIMKKVKNFNSGENKVLFLHDRFKIVYKKLGLKTLPSVFFIDKSGVIKHKSIETFGKEKFLKMNACLGTERSG